MPYEIDVLLLLGAGVLLVAVAVAKIGDRLGLPALLLFLGLGVAISAPYDFHLFDDAALAHDLGFAALVLILADGGLSTKWREIRPAIVPATLLATVGVVVTIAIVALVGRYVLALPWSVAVLVGAILAPTDSAAVFSVLRAVPLPANVRSLLEGESGLNDAPTVLLVIAMTQIASGTHSGGYVLLGLTVAAELVGGIILGLVLGWLGVRILRGFALPASGLYPLASLGWAVGSYGAGVMLHVSGFAAVYVCSVVLSNGKLPHRHATRSFASGIGWFAQIGLFVMLGLLAVPSRIGWPEITAATVAGLALTFVARPLAVGVCLTPFRIPWREQAFITWAGLRGAVPIILATIPLEWGIPRADDIFDLTFVAVIVLTLLNAPSLPWVAARLGLAGSTTEVDIEVAPLDRVEADMLQIRVPDGSRLHGVSVAELRLPANTTVTLVIRDERSFTPHGRDRLRTGDELLIVTPSVLRHQVEERLRSVGRGGRLAGWMNA
jgi:cell volume regulation protein A